eukprot:366569-Chlamydomonas_euryale.AAC.25
MDACDHAHNHASVLHTHENMYACMHAYIHTCVCGELQLPISACMPARKRTCLRVMLRAFQTAWTLKSEPECLHRAAMQCVRPTARNNFLAIQNWYILLILQILLCCIHVHAKVHACAHARANIPLFCAASSTIVQLKLFWECVVVTKSPDPPHRPSCPSLASPSTKPPGVSNHVTERRTADARGRGAGQAVAPGQGASIPPGGASRCRRKHHAHSCRQRRRAGAAGWRHGDRCAWCGLWGA